MALERDDCLGEEAAGVEEGGVQCEAYKCQSSLIFVGGGRGGSEM